MLVSQSNPRSTQRNVPPSDLILGKRYFPDPPEPIDATAADARGHGHFVDLDEAESSQLFEVRSGEHDAGHLAVGMIPVRSRLDLDIPSKEFL